MQSVFSFLSCQYGLFCEREKNGRGESAVGCEHNAKIFCIDPFGPKPIVVTGSHNYSAAASKKNDENFIIIRGNKRLAEAYAVNCMMTYNHYRWRAYLAESKREGREPWSFLEEDSAWQKRRTPKPTREMLKFWLP